MGREYVMVSCEEYDSLIDSADRLREENIDLCVKYAEVCQTSAMLRADMAHSRELREKLKDENAKLRELVRIAARYCDSDTCDGCPVQGESGRCQYLDMARELGVEVD